MRSALYLGSVIHSRLKPRRHRLRYRVFWMLLDLDEVPAIERKLRLFSHNRFNVFSVHDADHGDGGAPRAYVTRELAAHGIEAPGRILLFTMPRILGYVFNPLSIYFCHRSDGSLAALLYEVRNTFRQKHSYLIPVDGPAAVVRQSCAKDFYVSPFMDMGLMYRFRVAPPGDDISVAITAEDATGPVLTAALAARRQALTDAALARAFVTHPLLTLKVIAAIHWEALKLVAKGLRLRDRPPPPARAVTFATPSQDSRR